MKRSLEDASIGKSSEEESKVRSAWTEIEDQILLEVGMKYKGKHWKTVAEEFSVSTHKDVRPKTAKQCRERWHNHLNPNIRIGPWSKEDELKLFSLHSELGNKWSVMAERIPGRTDNAIKNYFFCKLRKIVRNVKDGIIDIDIHNESYEINHYFYLLNYLYQFYISPEKDMNVLKSLTSQIKGRKNLGDKYIIDTINQESITPSTFKKFFQNAIASFPNYNFEFGLKFSTDLATLLSSETENNIPKCSQKFIESKSNISSSQIQLPSLAKTALGSSASCNNLTYNFIAFYSDSRKDEPLNTPDNKDHITLPIPSNLYKKRHIDNLDDFVPCFSFNGYSKYSFEGISYLNISL